MVSFSRCWKNNGHRAWGGACTPSLAQRILLPVFVLLLALVLLGASKAAHADAVAADATPFIMERTEDGVYLSTTVNFDLPSVVDDVLRKGIAVHFVAEAELMRDRWYWSDKRIARTTRHMKLAFQPLVRRWKLQVGSSPIGNNGLGVTLSQNFESLADAMTAIQRFSRWRIADAKDIEADERYNVGFSFRLDVAQLPRPFQIGVVGQTEWSIAVSRNQKLPADFGKLDAAKSDAGKADSAKSEGVAK